MLLMDAPQEEWGLNWVTAIIPGQKGGASYGGSKKPLIKTYRFQLETQNPATVHTTLEALKTALEGRTSATSTWPKGAFRFYKHKDGDELLYLNECHLINVRIAPYEDTTIPTGFYSIVEINFQANDPDWQTGAAGGSGDTIDGPVTIDVPDGTDALQCYNTTGGENKVVIESDGNIKTKGEVYELQTSVS